MEKLELIFEDYNKAINEFFEREYQNKPDSEEDVIDCLTRAAGLKIDWESTPINEINMTPKEFFASIQDLDSLIEALKTGSLICDDRLPVSLTERFKDFGEEAIIRLFKIASDTESLGSDTINTVIACIQVLEVLKPINLLQSIFDLMYKLDASEEAVLEAITNLLICLQPQSLEECVSRLEKAQEIGVIEEFLMDVLASTNSEHKSDKFYKCLKSSFLRMENKSLGAVYLMLYGDSRAITALRGYLQKNINTIDKRTFYEIMQSVQKLGGNMDDLAEMYSNLHR